MRAISKNDNFISIAVEEGERVTLKGTSGGEVSITFPDECILNCYRKNVVKPLVVE